MSNMSVNVAGVEWKNPVTVASGTFGSGAEYSEFVDLNRLGAVTTKGVANKPWEGNPTPRVAEVYGGMLNAVGLQNPGIELFCKRDIPFLKQFDTKIVVNVCGHSLDEYLDVVKRLADEPIDMMEINISCPNVKEGGIAFGTDPKGVETITSEIKKYAKQPVIMKLSPNVTSIAEIARAAEAGGADAVSLINTITGMKIDINRRSFVLANKTGGMSGPAVHPVAVRMVYETAHAVNIPIIGMGGITNAADAIEMILAGATAVSVGTANFVNPKTTEQIVDGIAEYKDIISQSSYKGIAAYQIAVDRKYYLKQDVPTNRTDYPHIISVGAKAEQDLKCIHKGSMVLVDGMVVTREFRRTVTCPHCGKQFDWPEKVLEVLTFGTEYLADFMTPEEYDKLQAEKLQAIKNDIFTSSAE